MHSPEIRAGERGREFTDVDVLIQGYSTYLLHAVKLSPKTVLEYTKDVTRWAEWWKRPVEFFKQDEWDDWTIWLSRSNLAASSINRYRSSLTRFYAYLRRRKIVTHDPSYDSEAVRGEKRLPDICTEQEIAAMRRRLKAPRTRALFALLYDCGLRNKEARTLRVDQINPSSLHVEGKRAKDRIIPLTPEMYEPIDAWLAEKPASPYLFPTAGGNCLDEVAVYKLVVRIAKGAGILKHITPHSLRHSVATHLLERGMRIEDLQSFLGHDSIETTRRYVRLAQRSLKAAVLEHHPSVCNAKP